MPSALEIVTDAEAIRATTANANPIMQADAVAAILEFLVADVLWIGRRTREYQDYVRALSGGFAVDELIMSSH